MPKFITESELNAIKGLTHYLNSAGGFREADGVRIDAAVIDANGDTLGHVTDTDESEYGFVLPDGC